MHDIEPYYRWRDYYTAAEDEHSPFFGHESDEFHFTNKVYNYYIHPQWDDFGSSTLYLKILYTDYEEGFTVIELIGEWNDTLHNDIMELKREIIDDQVGKNITKFILIGEHVLNFHASDDSYYEEWYEDVSDEAGWIVILGMQRHVVDEMNSARLYQYLLYGEQWNKINWRAFTPAQLFEAIDKFITNPRLLLEENPDQKRLK
jgi:hypothetical protein